jgi:hypothetical protein
MNHRIKIGYCDSPLLKLTFATIEKGGLSIFLHNIDTEIQ